MKLKALFASLVAACMLLPGVAKADDPIELSFQLCYNPAHTLWGQVFKPWADSFAEKTNGKFTIHLFPNNAIVDNPEVSKAIKNGLMDMGAWTPFHNPRETPYLATVAIPSFMKNCVQGSLALRKWIETMPEAKKESQSVGIPIAAWTSAPTSIVSMTTPVHTPDDLKGRRILCLSGADANILTAWGALPVKISVPDLFVGLQRGMGDGCIGTPPGQKGWKVQEIAKSCSVIPSQNVPYILSINKESFEDLPKEYQDLLLESAKGLSDQISKALNDDIENALKLFADCGMEIVRLTPEQQKMFDDTQKLDSPDGIWAKYLVDNGIKGDPLELIRKAQEVANSIE